jgi:hypothetical protein
MLHILSLGAGVQSTALALMAAHGEVEPMPDCAIFADTGWEPAAVYEHLRWLMSANVLPFPVEIVRQGNIREDIDKLARGEAIRGQGRAATAPFFVAGKGGVAAPLRRQCTGHYKIEPIERRLKEKLGIKPRQRQPKTPQVELWIGISMDEIYRVKPGPLAWIERRWPLVEKRLSRSDCLLWMERRRYPTPAKSSCIGCPYHSNEHWRQIRQNPAEWEDAIAVDRLIRPGFSKTRSELFLHRSLVPLEYADIRSDGERGQGDLFNNECEGICGV